MLLSLLFFFNDTATTEIYTLSLHDALSILINVARIFTGWSIKRPRQGGDFEFHEWTHDEGEKQVRSEEHTSELQSRQYLVCRLLLEKKKIKKNNEEIR